MEQKIKKLESGSELSKCKEENEKLLAIFNSVRDGIAIIDKTGKIIFINKSLVGIGGYSEKDLINKRLAVLKMFTPISLAKILSVFAQRMAGREIPLYTVEAKTRDGEKKLIEIQGSILKIKNKSIGDVAILRDVTDREKSEGELKKKNEELEKFNKLAIGREMRIIELKKKIKELEGKLNQK